MASGPASAPAGGRGLVALADTSALTPDEERRPALQELVRRFNPAMLLPIEEVWPVEVRYAWHDGSDVRGRVEATLGRAAREWVAVPHRQLEQRDWSDLPAATRDGRPIRYYLDAPGDDRPQPHGRASSWRRRFREINRAGMDDPRRAAYPPTQYAHVFWWNRELGLLAVQYLFYYPFNEWVNHHEGDWERIQIVLRGPATVGDDLSAFTPIGYQYFFHQSWTELGPDEVDRTVSVAGREHPLVFVGGHGEWFGWQGSFSGGSYPRPGRYPRAGCEPRWLAPDEQVGQASRFIPAADFQVILLPEPERLDVRRRPELSWLRLPLHAGQRQSHQNPPGHRTFRLDRSPVQPAVRADWRAPPRSAPYRDLPHRDRNDRKDQTLAAGFTRNSH